MPEPWTVIITPRADKDMRHIAADHAQRVTEALKGMQANPYQGDVRRLEGKLPGWRRRVGEWRIRFVVDEDARAVVVLRVLPRGSAYD